MITVIKGSTTIDEIIEIITFIKEKEEKSHVSFRIFGDFSGSFITEDFDDIVNIEDLKKYIRHEKSLPTSGILANDTLEEIIERALDSPEGKETILNLLKKRL